MAETTPLNFSELNALKEEYPSLPDDYFDYMRTVGWGVAKNGKMIYSGPIHPDEIYGDHLLSSKVILLGDDFQGYCFGFDPEAQTYGEFSDGGDWEPLPKEKGFRDYVAELK